jgi:hypothetical protein
LAREVNADSVMFLEKETFTDAVAGTRHVVDLLARVQLRSAPGHILIHVENQADSRQAADFPHRMFRYFAGLEARHGGSIYPVAVLSYVRPRKRRSDRFDISLPGLRVLRFRFRQVQLNRLPWRRYVRRKNPVAAALMSRMDIEPRERWRVKLDCLALLVTLHLDPAREQLISSFVDTYLKLNRRQSKLFRRGLEAMPVDKREGVLELTTSWKEEGRAEGRAEGRRQGAVGIVMRLLQRHLPDLPPALGARVASLPVDRLERLADGLLDLQNAQDLELWLDA